MMQGIMRIPTEGNSLESMIQSEREYPGYEIRELPAVLSELLTHSQGNADHIHATLDWAMQIRETQGIEWAECLDLAMTFYFG